MRKKILVYLLAAASVMVALAGCKTTTAAPEKAPAATTAAPAAGTVAQGGSESQDSPGEEGIKVAMVINRLGDMGFNDEAFAGLQLAGEELGVEYNYVECPQSSEAETQMRMLADTEEYALILVVGADRKDAVETVAEDYPEQKFSLIDSVVTDLPNLHGVASRDPEQTFLSGVIAGLVTKDESMALANSDNVIGFVGGMDSPSSRAGAAGFLSGVKYVNPEAELIYTIVGSYQDPSKAKEIALTAYGRGADVISHNCGASGMGVFSAAEEVNRYVIGSSKATVDPARSLCTSVKKTDVFVYQEIESVINGTWEAGSTRKGIKEGICDYNTEGLETQLPEDMIKIVEEIKQKMVDGELQLPEDPDAIDEWIKTNQYVK